MEESSFFQINRCDMSLDYEFIGNINIEKEHNCINDDYLNANILVFKIVNSLVCMEISTELEFLKVDKDHYYNEDTGLVFNIDSIFNRGVNPFIDSIAFPLYESYAVEFLDKYKTIKMKDDEIKDKYCAMLLKKKKIFTKEED